MYAYTTPRARRVGLAKALLQHVEEVALTAGYQRLRSLASTLPGYALHASCGHHFWGVTAKGELLVDTPLQPHTTRAGSFPAGTPRYARSVAGGRTTPLSPIELAAVLSAPGSKFT
jgi:GNAT superfamily N-acetyltransferase